ncbi:MAG: STAS/SEC14 domain-containing protein [Crocinitomicaceae bacterium]|nr:STAS/SEC14 domain-containing protein [Crocinitomicaceae bacterium]
MEKVEFETRVAEIQEKEGICHVKIKAGVVIALEDTKDIDEVFKKLANNNRIVICADITQIKYVTFEARRYRSKSPMNKLIIAMALITKSHMARIIGSFIIGLNKPPFQVKIFNSESAAVDWLQQFTPLKSKK